MKSITVIVICVVVMVCAASSSHVLVVAVERVCSDLSTKIIDKGISDCQSFVMFFREPTQTLSEIGSLFQDSHGIQINMENYNPNATVADMIILGSKPSPLFIPVSCSRTSRARRGSEEWCWIYSESIFYIAQEGDSMVSIAEKTYQHQVTAQVLIDENHSMGFPMLPDGQFVLMPGNFVHVPIQCNCGENLVYVTYRVRQGDTAASIAAVAQASESDVKAAGNIAENNVLVFPTSRRHKIIWIYPYPPIYYGRNSGTKNDLTGGLIMGLATVFAGLVMAACFVP